MIIYHPQLDDDGRQVALRKPSAATGPHCWHDPELAATVLPGRAMPDKLGHIAIAPWHANGGDGAAWVALAGQVDALEPPLNVPPGNAGAAGTVIIEDDGRVWLVAPSNQFGGYAATFPKGRIDAGEDQRCAAVREADLYPLLPRAPGPGDARRHGLGKPGGAPGAAGATGPVRDASA
jgi:8-oxo-dGTP pyrophosphatase MutT (NUDIX family)